MYEKYKKETKLFQDYIVGKYPDIDSGKIWMKTSDTWVNSTNRMLLSGSTQ